MELAERVVLITGASMGIGEALARAYADEGAQLVLAARSTERLEQVVSRLPQGRALAVPTDLTDPRQIAELVDRGLQRFGRVDVLVNNAGVGLFSTLSDMDRVQFQRLFALNVFAPIHLIQTVLPQMKYRRQGQIINVSSVAGYVAMPAMGAYAASKFSLRALTDSLRVEVKPFGIHVLGVYPGRIRTPFADNAYWGTVPQGYRSRRGGISAERCARAIVAGSRKEKREIMVPGALRAFIGLSRWFPGTTDRLLARLFRDS